MTVPGSVSPQIVFVPGAFTGAWIWADVVAGLEAQGISSRVLELPTTGEGAVARSFDDDVLAVSAALDAITEPALVCGHSYGGAVMTAAAKPQAYVHQLVYLAAAAPASGSSMAEASAAAAAAAGQPADGPGPAPREDGLMVFPPEVARQALFNDCSHDRAHEALDQLSPQSFAGFDTTIGTAAWTQIPSTYVRATRDLVPRALGDGFLEACDAIVDIDAGHCPHWSQPAKVVEILVARLNETAPKA